MIAFQQPKMFYARKNILLWLNTCKVEIRATRIEVDRCCNANTSKADSGLMCVYYNKNLCLAVKELQHKQAQKHCHSFCMLHFVEDVSPCMWWAASFRRLLEMLRPLFSVTLCLSWLVLNLTELIDPLNIDPLCFQNGTDGADEKTSSGNINSLPHISDCAFFLHKRKDRIKKKHYTNN